MKNEMLLSAKNLSVRFGGVLAVNNVSFDVRQGEVFTLIGPNGAGKTTVFNLISRIYTPTTGSIEYLGPNGLLKLTEQPPQNVASLGIARTFQNIELFEHASVLHNLLIGRHTHRATGLWQDLFFTSKVREAELETDAELVTVLAPASDGYRYIPTLWAALLAMLTPLLVFQLGFWLGWYEILLVQWSVWLLLSLLFHWTPIKMRLIPKKVRQHRAALMARLQFVEQGLHRTRDRLGVLIFVSVAEHYVEILVDDGIAQHIDNAQWQQIIDDFVVRVRNKEVEQGFLECVERTSAILTDAFPATRDQNELPDSLIILDKP